MGIFTLVAAATTNMVKNSQTFWLMAVPVLLLLVLAGLGVSFFWRKKTEKVLARRVEQLLLLNEIGRQITAVLNVDRLFEDVVDLVREKFGYDHVAILTIDRERDLLCFRAVVCSHLSASLTDNVLPLDQGLAGWVVQHNQPLLVNDVRADPRYVNIFPAEHSIEVRAELAIPIQLRGGVMGVLDVQSPQVGAFDNNDLLILHTLAHQVAVTMENGRLYEAVQQELRERREVEQALRQSEAQYRELVQCAPAGIYEIDFVNNRFVSVNEVMCAYTGYTPEEFLAMSPLDLLTPQSRRVFLEHYAKILSGAPVPKMVEYSIKSKSDQELWLIFNVSFKYASAKLVGATVVGATVVAHDITPYKLAQRRLDAHARQQAALFHISADLVTTLDAQEICQKVVFGLRKTLQYDLVGIFLLDETNNERVLYACTHPSAMLPGLRLKPGQGLTEAPLRDGRAHYVPDISQEAAYVPGLAHSRSEIDIPINVGQKVAGVLSVESTRLDAFNEDDFAILTAVANQASVALARAREHQAVKEAEERFQSMFNRVPVGLFQITPQGKFIDANPALVDILNYPDLAALKLANMLDLFVEQTIRAQWQSLMEREGIVRGYETEMRCYNGALIWIKTSMNAVLGDDDTAPFYFEGTMENITTRKQAEHEIRHLKEFNEGIVQTMAEGIVVEDVDGYYTFVNPAAVAMLGYDTVEEIIGLHWRDIVSPDKHHVTEAANQRRIQGESDRYELKLVRKNGERLPVLVGGTPRFAENKFTGTLAVFTDISQRVKAEAEIQRRNRDLTLLNKIIAASAASSENETILNMVCREVALAFDLPYAVAVLLDEEKTLAMPTGSYSVEGTSLALPRSFLLEYLPLLQQRVADKTPLVITNAQTDPRLVMAQGWTRRLNLVAMVVLPFVDKDEVLGFLALAGTQKRNFLPEEIELAQSITDQVSVWLARVRLDEERRQLSAIIEQTVDSIIITTIAGEIVYVNPAFERASGYERQEVAGRDANFLESGEHTAAFFANMGATIRSGKVWHGHIVNRKKNGAFYTSETIIAPVRNEAGEITNYVWIQRDVTRQLELEEQLRRSQRMEAVGQLTAGIAHDFNNLLTAINGFAELLQRQLPPNGLQHEMAGKILHSGEHAAELINQLLAFSRKQVISPKVLNINHIIVNINKILQRVIGEEIELSLVLASGLWLAEVDPTQIEQVIINLAVNARDAMAGGGKLTIETKNVVLDETYMAGHLDAVPGEYVLMIVSDTGHGMSKEIQARIFEPFFTTKKVNEGTGLGLASVFGAVKQSGGNIWVYSEEGLGTTFKVYLPRSANNSFNNLEAANPVELPQGTETILLVEDETMVRDFAARVLTEQGYTVLQAGNGREALQISRQHTEEIHLLLTDVVMPEMGGKLLSERIKLGYPNIKILFTSGYTDGTIIRQGILADNLAFIQKPFSPAELAVSVRTALDDGFFVSSQ